MKRKYLFYSTSKLWGFHQQYFTLMGWLRFKDHILLQKRFEFLTLSRYSIRLKSKRRHKRSIAIRNRNLFDYKWVYRKVVGYRIRGKKTKGLWLEPCSHRLTYRLAYTHQERTKRFKGAKKWH